MNIFNKRPLLLSLFIFCISACVSTIFTATERVYFLCSCILLFAISLLVTLIFLLTNKKCLNILITVSLCIGFALISSLSSHFFLDKKLVQIENLGAESEVIAVINECTYSAPYMTTYTADIKSISGKKVNFKASLSSNPPIYFEDGETICADLIFSPFTVTEYGFDSRILNISNGILTTATIENVKHTENNSSFSILQFFQNIRRVIERRIDNSFKESSAIVKALLIGESNEITTSTKTAFSRLGINHILSISGTHFSVLLGMIAIILSSVGINKRILYFLLIPIALFYVGLSNFSYSVCRAGIMAVISYSGFLFGRVKDSYTALFISLFIILTVTPYSVFSISLWLSFTATFTILVIIDLLAPFIVTKNLGVIKSLAKYVIVHLLITVSVIFTTLPIVSAYFGYISKLAPLANIILVPLFEVFLYIIPFSVLFSTFGFISNVTDNFGKYLLLLVEKLSSNDNLLIAINQRFVTAIAITGLITTLILLALPLKKKFLIAIPSILSIVAIAVCLFIFYDKRVTQTNVTFFNTGVSDALIITDSNNTASIDITSGTSSAVYYTEAVVKEHHSTKISAHIFTHYRSNHINSFKKLADRMEITKAYFPLVTDEKSINYMEELMDVARKHRIEIIPYEYGDIINFYECEITVTPPQFLKRSTHEVISVFVATEKDDLLYLGSSFSETNFDYLNYVSDAEYIIFGQHYPKAKNKFEIITNALQIYASVDIFNLANNAQNANILNKGDKYSFLLK